MAFEYLADSDPAFKFLVSKDEKYPTFTYIYNRFTNHVLIHSFDSRDILGLRSGSWWRPGIANDGIKDHSVHK